MFKSFFITSVLLFATSCAITVEEGNVITGLKKEGKSLTFKECALTYNTFLLRTYLSNCQDKSIDL
ncbi:MAG: hypothetical protein HN509_09285 [Halobacteriovoraceae bacterium]|nr:hypothetical protein [Halobacteriovoraceae bacterium]